jgi:hypothetical protein
MDSCVCIHVHCLYCMNTVQVCVKNRIFRPPEINKLRVYEIYTFFTILLCTKELFLVGLCKCVYRTSKCWLH